MMVCARLKTNVKQEKRIILVHDILSMLNLYSAKDVYTQNLSGGQKKRLAIALELVNNPPIMFLDEPTSGLDSSTSFQVISLLQVLAHQGRTIVCTIHQPSAKLFELFDKVYVVSEGKCIYQGNLNAMLHFLEMHNLECPKTHNPADFMIEVASGDYGEVDRMYQSVISGECEKLQQIYPRSLFDNTCKVNSSGNGLIYAGKVLEKPKMPDKKSCDVYVSTYFKQFRILLWRTFQSQVRNPSLTHARLISIVLVGTLLGLLYFQIGDEADRVIPDNAGLLFFSMLFLLFSSVMPVLMAIPLELPIFIREHQNCWYSLDMYYLAKICADVPFQIIFPTISSVIVYFMTGQPLELSRFFLYLTTNIIISFVGGAFGFMVGTFTPNAELAAYTGPILLIPMFLFAGFFVKSKAIPLYLRWASFLSLPKYGYEALLLSIYGNNRARLDCKYESGELIRMEMSGKCRFQNASLILRELDVENENPSNPFLILFLFFIAFRVLSYFSFKIRIAMVR